MSASTYGAWTQVGTGVEYQQFTLPDPNNVFVTRMDRRNLAVTIDSSIGSGKLSCCAETIRNQAARYQDAVSYWNHDWGQRSSVIAAINGDFWSGGVPANGQVQSGWLVKQIDPFYHYFYLMDRRTFIAQAGTDLMRVTWPASGVNQTLHGINRARGSNELIVYTHQYDTTTLTSSSGSEVVVEVARPNLALPSSEPLRGRVVQVRANLGSTPIHFDQVVLSASGTAASTLLSNASVGAEVNIVNHLDSSLNVDRAYAAMGGGEVFLINGVVVGGQAVLHPRTAIAHNDDYVFFVVCDGRSSISIGMTLQMLGDFCKNHLGADWGMNLDGGGSSTLVVNGVTRNRPSDGTDRAVANGLMMVAPQPKQQSTAFSSGDRVRISGGTTNVRLGPGTHMPILTTMALNTQGDVLDHSLRGIYAKGFNWWKLDFAGTIGWVAQSNLASVSTGNLARVTQHPASVNVCPGASTSLTVAATGTGSLGYRWQRDGVNLTSGGRFSGATSSTLGISNADSTVEGSYRCVVTDGSGQVTSYSAGVSLRASIEVTDPSPQTVWPMLGAQTAVFSVTATGDGTLGYQWQKDSQNISNGGHFSGATTPALTVSNADSSVRGAYRCIVSANCGSQPSSAAPLTVVSVDFDADGDSDLADFAHLQQCLGVWQVAEPNPDCLDADFNNDQHVNTSDAGWFIQCLRGANTPLPPGC